MIEEHRWLCAECDHVSLDSEILRAPSPFDDTDEIVGCPKCKAAETLVWACHSDGCVRVASIGEPWPDRVYRWSCHSHSSRTWTGKVIAP